MHLLANFHAPSDRIEIVMSTVNRPLPWRTLRWNVNVEFERHRWSSTRAVST